jgi:transposase
MEHVDMRKLAAAAQEERRRQVVGLREAGLTYGAIAAQVGLTQTGVFDICKRFAAHGEAGLKSHSRGPEAGFGRLLDQRREAEVRDLICTHLADALGLPFALWSRAAVAALIEQRYGLRLAVRTTGKYLARWGFTPQQPSSGAMRPGCAPMTCTAAPTRRPARRPWCAPTSVASGSA